MTDKAQPPKDPNKLPEKEAEARFNRLVGELVKTPPKPHKPLKEPVARKGR